MNLNEELQRIKEIMQVDEMAYPTDFKFEEYGNIKSFAGKIKYAQERLLGKVGAGSGRAVFRVDDEKVLKVALNAKGVAQNASEAEGYKQNYEIVAKVFDADQDDALVEMELAKKVNPNRFKQLTGVSLEEVVTWLGYITGKVLYRPHQTVPNDLSENEFAEDLRTFAADYDYPVPGDFGRINSYGEVLRNGQPRIVLVDFGYDSDAAEVYNASNERSFQRARQRQLNRY